LLYSLKQANNVDEVDSLTTPTTKVRHGILALGNQIPTRTIIKT